MADFEPEVYYDAVGRGPVVVVEVLAGLDVVLVAVGPVQVDLLAVVGDGVPLIAPVPPPGDEVSVLVVAAEEGVQAVVDVGLDGLAAAPRPRGGLGCQVLLAHGGTMKAVVQLAVGVDLVSAEGGHHVLTGFFQVVGGLGLPGKLAAVQLPRYAHGQPLADELLDGVPLVVHDAVDAEVQVGAVELEQLAQQPLELQDVSFSSDEFASHIVISPMPP